MSLEQDCMQGITFLSSGYLVGAHRCLLGRGLEWGRGWMKGKDVEVLLGPQN